MTQKVLTAAGIDPRRVLLEWVSSAGAQRFADLATRMVQTISDLGPLDRTAQDLALEAVRRTLDSEMVRWTVGKETTLLEKGDLYGRQWTAESFEPILDHLAGVELEKHLIYTALQRGGKSVRDLRDLTGLELARISYLISDMERTGMIEFKGMLNHKPQFAAL